MFLFGIIMSESKEEIIPQQHDKQQLKNAMEEDNVNGLGHKEQEKEEEMDNYVFVDKDLTDDKESDNVMNNVNEEIEVLNCDDDMDKSVDEVQQSTVPPMNDSDDTSESVETQDIVSEICETEEDKSDVVMNEHSSNKDKTPLHHDDTTQLTANTSETENRQQCKEKESPNCSNKSDVVMDVHSSNNEMTHLHDDITQIAANTSDADDEQSEEKVSPSCNNKNDVVEDLIQSHEVKSSDVEQQYDEAHELVSQCCDEDQEVESNSYNKEEKTEHSRTENDISDCSHQQQLNVQENMENHSPQSELSRTSETSDQSADNCESRQAFCFNHSEAKRERAESQESMKGGYHGDVPISDWLINHCTTFSHAVFTEDAYHHVEKHGTLNGISSFSISESGKYIVVDIKKGVDEYTFISFRGLKTVDEFVYGQSQLMLESAVLDCLKNFPLDVIQDAITSRRKVVMTGHCLGGVCAMALAFYYFYVLPLESFENHNLQCVTFGCPLAGGDMVIRCVSQYRQFFHNFVLANDVTPFMFDLMSPVFDIVFTILTSKEIPQTIRRYVDFSNKDAEEVLVMSLQNNYLVQFESKRIDIILHKDIPRGIQWCPEFQQMKTYAKHIHTCVPPYWMDTPHTILERICPLVSIMIDANRDQYNNESDKTSNENVGKDDQKNGDILNLMHSHCTRFADSIPLDFAFRILLYPHTEENSPFIDAFLDRLHEIELPRESFVSKIIFFTIRTITERLKSKKIDSVDFRQKCSKYLLAFGKTFCQTIDIEDKCVKVIRSPLLNEEFFIDCYGLPFNSFWSNVCERKVKVILDFSRSDMHSKYFLHNMKPDDSWEAVPKKFKIEFLYREDLYCSYNSVKCGVLDNYKVTKPNNETTVVLCIRIGWGNQEIPAERGFKSVLETYKAKLSLYTKNNGNVCICDSTNGAAATFILTRLLSSISKEEAAALDNDPKGLDGMMLRLSASKAQIRFARKFGISDGDDMKGTMAVLDYLQHTIWRRYQRNMKSASEFAITAPCIDLATDERVPFFSLIGKAVAAQNLRDIDANSAEAVQDMMLKATSARFNAQMIAAIVEDVMGFDDKILQEELDMSLTDNSGRTWRFLGAALRTVAGISGRAWQAAKERRCDWRSVDFHHVPDSSYPDVVRSLYERVSVKSGQDLNVLDMEAYIDSLIPESVKTSDLCSIMKRKKDYFRGSNFEHLLVNMSSLVFQLKMIHHCRELRIIREQLKLITIGGEANVGKSTLVESFVGEDDMVAEPGIGLENRTLMPIAYRDEVDTSMIWCDLPGCTDKGRMDLSRLFIELGDVVVFCINASTAEESADESLEQLVSYIVNECTGPRLICINQADCYIKSVRRRKKVVVLSTEDIESRLDQACSQWRQKELFRGVRRSTNPMMEIEAAKPHAHVLNSSDSSLSVWLTCFSVYDAEKMTDQNEEYIKQMFFTDVDVKEWVLANLSSS